MSLLLDLLRQVRSVLPWQNGGSGNQQGWSTGVILRCVNRTGSTLTVGTVVKLASTWDDSRVVATSSASDPAVAGVVVGYFTDFGLLVEAAAPSGGTVAVLQLGIGYVYCSAAVTRGQYAFSSSTSGQASSSATVGAGAFGQFLETTSGAGLALCQLRPVLGISSSSFGTPALTLGTANSAGVATTAIRTDATILAFDSSTPAALGTGSAGTGNVASRSTHVHPKTSLANLSDATLTSPSADDYLRYNGSAWVNVQGSAEPNIWRPLLDGAGAIIVDGTGQAVMAYGPA